LSITFHETLIVLLPVAVTSTSGGTARVILLVVAVAVELAEPLTFVAVN
jgi:hypothetical protein